MTAPESPPALTAEQIEALREQANGQAVTALSPARWFDDGRFVPARLAAATKDAGHLRRGVDGALYRYDGGVYRPDGEGFVRRFTRDQLGERFRANHVREILAWLEGEPVTLNARQPERWLNLDNGLLDWRTGELHDHTPEVTSTIQHPVAWDADAGCPAVDRFLGQVFPDDAATFAVELVAYALWPAGNPFRRAVQLLGDGRNGKSVFLRLLTAIVGKRNVATVPLQTLAENRFAPAELYGKAANVAGDLDARAIRRSDVFKMVTGGDPILAERKYAQPFTFTCTAVPFFSANEPPISSDQSPAWFDRWTIVPFPHRFTEADADPNIDRKITTDTELSGLLTRAVQAMRALDQRGRLGEPASVRQAGGDYRRKLDTAAAFVDEHCEFDPDHFQPRSALYRAYRSWCSDVGRLAVSAENFYAHLRRNHPTQIEDAKVRGVRGFNGIRLHTGPEL